MLSFLLEYWYWILLGGLAVAGLSAFAYMQKNWHFIVAAGAVLVSMASIARAFNAGGKAEREKQKVVQDKVVKQVQDIQRKVETMPKKDVDKELEKWLRD